MAKNTISQRIALEGGEEVKKIFKELGAAGEKAFKDLQAAANFKTTPLGAALKNFQTQINALRQSAIPLGSAFTGFTTAAVKFGTAVENSARKIALVTAAVGGAAAALGVFFKNQAAESERIQNTADSLGLSVEAYQAVQAAASNMGIEVGSLDTILTKFAIGAAKAGDETGKIGDGLDKGSKALQNFTVKAEDGSDKIITVRRGVQELGGAMQTFSGDAKGGIGALQDFAAQLQRMGSVEERLLFLSEKFGARKAREALIFFSNLSKVIDQTSRSANKILEPLSAAEIAIGVKLDDAVDSATTNLTFLKGRLATLFDPALTAATQRFSNLLYDNSKAILAFANIVATDASEALKSFTDSLKGVTFADVISAYEQVKTGIKAVATAVKTVVFEIIIPAFRALLAVADTVAATINRVFGTELTGAQLLAGAAILKFVGALKLLGATINLTYQSGKLFVSFLLNFNRVMKLTGAGLVLFSRGFDKLILSLVRFAAHPVVAAVLIIGGAIAYLALKQSDAEKAAEAHKEALAELDLAFAEVEAGIPGAVQRLEELKQKQLESAKASIVAAEALIEQGKALKEFLPPVQGAVKGMDELGASADEMGNKIIKEGNRNLQTATQRLAELEGRINSLAKGSPALADAMAEVKNETRSLTGAVNGLTGTAGRVEGWSDSMQKHVKKVDPAFTEAAIAARQLQAVLAQPPAVQPFVKPEQLTQLKAGIDSVTASQREAARVALETATAQVESITAMLDALPKDGEGSGVILQRIQLLKDLDAALLSLKSRRDTFDALDDKLADTAQTLPKASGAVDTFGGELGTAGGKADSFGKDIGSAATEVGALNEKLREIPAATSEFDKAVAAMTASLVDPFLAARDEIELIWTGLETFLTARLTQFSTSVDAIVARIRAALAAVQVDLDRANAGAQGAPGTGIPPTGQLLTPGSADQAAQAVLTAWRAVQAGLTPIFTSISAQAASLWAEIGEGAVSGLSGIASTFQEAVVPLPAIWQEIVAQIVAAASSAASALVAPFTAASSAIQSSWLAMIATLDSALLSLVNRVESLLASLQARLNSIRAAISAAQSESGGGGRGLAGGGRVYGPGTATSDNIPAWLSPGEFVVRAAAVDKVGPSFLSLLNSGRYDLEELFRRFSKIRLPKLNMGGLLDMPRFAEGGLVSAGAGFSGQPVYLRFGNDTVGPLQGSADVVGTLMRHAVREHTLSAGRKPGRG